MVTAHRGDFPYFPEGGSLGFCGADHAAMLLMFASGGPREDYFKTLVREEQMNEQQRAEFMLDHDTLWV